MDCGQGCPQRIPLRFGRIHRRSTGVPQGETGTMLSMAANYIDVTVSGQTYVRSMAEAELSLGELIAKIGEACAELVDAANQLFESVDGLAGGGAGLEAPSHQFVKPGCGRLEQ